LILNQNPFLRWLVVILLYVVTTWAGMKTTDQVRDKGLFKTITVMLADQKSKLKAAAHSLTVVLGHAVAGMDDSSIRNETLRRYFRDMRFEQDQSSYFFIYKNTVNIVHPVNEKLPGTDMGDVKDPNGVYLVKHLYQAARTGGDYVRYIWVKPVAADTPKLSYAEMIPGSDLWMGTGVYLDNIDQYLADRLADVVGKFHIHAAVFDIGTVKAARLKWHSRLEAAYQNHHGRF
jgi:methyl-accepting chemotaxis protein